MTLFIESELHNRTHPSDRASIAFEKIFHWVRPSRNFASSKTVTQRFFFFKERYSGFVSVSATRAEQRPEGSKLFFLFLRFLPPPTGSFTVISVPKVYGVSSRFKHPCSPFLFFSRVTLSWSTSSFERRAGIKSRAVIMNDSRGEREDIIVIDGREGRSRGWLPFNLEANPFVHLLPLLPGRHRAA